MRVYVYLQMPGTFEVVTAGRYDLEVRDGISVGTFRYNPTYLVRADAVALDPIALSLAGGPFETTKLKGIFGALRDALPDAWGRRVIERDTGRADFSEAEFLLHSPEDRAGALSFGHGREPPAPFRRYNPVIALEALHRLAEKVQDEKPIKNEPHAGQVEQLLRPGTSMGGARPKNVVEDGEGLWIAKFPDRGDRWSNARVERSMLELARECGIDVPQTRVASVAGADVLLVKRFDREMTPEGYLRARMLSGLTLLDTQDAVESRREWSYLTLADEVRRRSSRSDEDQVELLRRIAFNALISNTDDHPRNHAMYAPRDKFRLSPAYDLTPNPLVSTEKRDLAMTVGRWNRYANRENILSAHARFRLTREDAAAVVDGVRACVAGRWRAVLAANNVTAHDTDTVAPAFDYPGFLLDPGLVLGTK